MGHVAWATLMQMDTLLIFKCDLFLLSIACVSEPLKSFGLHLYAEFCSRQLRL